MLRLSFEFASRTPESKTKIVVKCDELLLDGQQFQIDNLDSGWSSGRIKLSKGASCDVQIPKMGANTFRVSLFMANGAPVASGEERIIDYPRGSIRRCNPIFTFDWG